MTLDTIQKQNGMPLDRSIIPNLRSFHINIPQILPNLNISTHFQMLRQLPKRILSRFSKSKHQETESVHNQNAQEPTHAACKSLDRNRECILQIGQSLVQASRDHDKSAWDNTFIYRIPKCLREAAGDDNAYSPQIVSLGPYHHGQERLSDMERHKYRALKRILLRNEKKKEQDYIDEVKSLEIRARACYEEPYCSCVSDGSHSMECSNKFVVMMMVDSCFVLEILWGAAMGFADLGYSIHDPVFAMRAAMHMIQRDMMKLENQIPLFILDALLALQTGNPGQKGVVSRLAISFFDPLTPTYDPCDSIISINPVPEESDEINLLPPTGNGNSSEPSDVPDELHLLNVFRRNLLGFPLPSNERHGVADKRRQHVIPCVTKLKEEGITIHRGKTKNFWDIKFENGVLKIPRLLIHNGTKSLFLNLIAYEQCHLDCKNEITSYIIFMDNLIDNPEDVTYLYSRGIIEHWLGSDAEVAELFNGMCQEVIFDVNKSYLSSVSEKVNKYHRKKWNGWRASLKHTYFNSPWSIISFFAALLLLLLTALQTFYTLYAYYKPA